MKMEARRSLRNLTLVGVLLAAAQCSSDEPDRRVLVVAVDGATRKVIDPLMAAGELPTLAALQREGATGVLRPDLPILSPRIWASVATGREPRVHGIGDWVRQDEDGNLHLFNGTDRRSPAIWNILSAADRSVVVLNWLQTQPPERINGVMVSDHAIQGIYEDRLPLAARLAEVSAREGGPVEPDEIRVDSLDVVVTSPPDWAPRVAEFREIESPLTDVPNPFAARQWQDGAMTSFLSSRYENDEHVTRMALALEEEVAPELLMVYLPGIDRISHFLWNGIEMSPEADPKTVELMQFVGPKHKKALETYYRFVDELLALLVARYDSDDLVLVLSDHGFEAGVNPSGQHSTDEARDGVIFARGPGLSPGGELPLLTPVDITPTILDFLGLPLAEDMPGVTAFGAPTSTERVFSYQTVPVEREGSGKADNEEFIENLRALGYVD